MKIKVHHNGDDVFIAWKPKGFMPGCRGFVLQRRRNGAEEIVSTWVGFGASEKPFDLWFKERLLECHGGDVVRVPSRAIAKLVFAYQESSENCQHDRAPLFSPKRSRKLE